MGFTDNEIRIIKSCANQIQMSIPLFIWVSIFGKDIVVNDGLGNCTIKKYAGKEYFFSRDYL